MEYGRIVDSALAPIESSALGRHLVAAADAGTMRALLGTGRAAALPTDGTTDIGPLLQQAYDQGSEIVQLESGATYVWDSPVFLDDGGTHSGLVIAGNRAVIQLGAHLPTTGWMRDGTTRFAIFPNTRRSALSGGRVAVGAATRATGTHGAVRPLTVRDVIIDGRGRNVGFSYANQAGITFEQVTLLGARVGATWAGYADANVFIGCYSRAGGGVAAQTMVEQTDPGDGLVLIGGKADPQVAFARLKGCRGATIQGMVTARLVFDRCTAIVVQGSHFEGQGSDAPMVTVRNSQVSMTGCTFYQTYDPAGGAIVVDDSPADSPGSDLALHDCTGMQLVTPAQRATTYSPLVLLTMALPGTRVRARGLQGRCASTGAPGTWRDTAQPRLAAKGVAGLDAALSTAAARTAIASGDFDLCRSGAGWRVQGPSGVVVSRRQAAPALVSVSPRTNMAHGGELAAGTRYSYVAAVRDGLGRSTTHSGTGSVVADANGVNLLQVEVPDAPAVLILWRSTGGNPDRYAILPVRSNLVHLYDTGDRIAGTPWIRSRVPSPSAARRNRTRDALLVDGKAVGR